MVTAQWYHSGMDSTIRTADIVRNDHSTTSVPSGTTLSFHFQYTCDMDDMDSSVCDRFYWKRINDITTLANTTWVFHNDKIINPNATAGSTSITVNFTSNSTSYSTFKYDTTINISTGLDMKVTYGSTDVYTNLVNWTDQAYRTITFASSGTQLTNANLIRFMCANATLQ